MPGATTKKNNHFIEAIQGYYYKKPSGEIISIEKGAAELREIEKTNASSSQDLVGAANEMMTKVFDLMRVDLEKQNLNSMGFAIVTDELYLLQMRLNSEKVKPRTPDDITWIVHIQEQDKNIHYSIPGKGIESDDPTDFSIKISTSLRQLIESSFV